MVLNLSSQGYREYFYNTNSKDKDILPQKYADEVDVYIKILTDKHYKVIVNSLAMPRERLFGNYSACTLYSIYGSVLRVNELIKKSINNTTWKVSYKILFS